MSISEPAGAAEEPSEDTFLSYGRAPVQTGARFQSRVRVPSPQVLVRQPEADVDGPLLRHAIATDALGLAMQPLVELGTGRLRGFEALCRWQQNGRDVSPVRFIAAAETHRLITALTVQVARRAAQRVAAWREDGLEASVNINVSPGALLDPTFHTAFVTAIEAANCPPWAIGIEITESTVITNPEAVARALIPLRSLGMRVDIDDFGTGYSSLARLVDLPIDALKIDCRFVGSMARDHRTAAIVRTTIDMAHGLGLEAIAEGVEDRQTWQLLGALGCDRAQGHFIAPPMPAHQVDAWLRSPDLRVELQRRASDLDQDAQGSPCDVLVVDDEPAIRELVRQVLEDHGFCVASAADGEQALRVIDRVTPKLVLVDVQMPIVDGAALARIVRSRGIGVPIVIMTAGPSAALWAREVRADGFLSKPFDIAGVLAIADRYAGRQDRP